VGVKQQADRLGGLDVHRDNVVAATRINDPGGEVSVTKKKFPTTRRGLAELAAFLTEEAVSRVAMEATGVCTGSRSTTPLRGSSTSCGCATPST